MEILFFSRIFIEVREMNFCTKLQKLRKEKHLSQEQLSDMLDVSRQSVSQLEGGST